MSRLRLLVVPQNEVLDWFTMFHRKPGHINVPRYNLPDGAVVRAVHHDFNRMAFAFLVEHPSFDPVPDGDLVPSHPAGPVQYEAVPVPVIGQSPPCSRCGVPTIWKITKDSALVAQCTQGCHDQLTGPRDHPCPSPLIVHERSQ